MENLSIHFPIKEPTIEEFIEDYVDIEIDDPEKDRFDYEDGPFWEITF